MAFVSTISHTVQNAVTGVSHAVKQVGKTVGHSGEATHLSDEAKHGEPHSGSNVHHIVAGISSSHPAPKKKETRQQKLRTSGLAAVKLAKKFLGRQSGSISSHGKNGLPNYQHAGGITNDCADFVSSVEKDTGRLGKHEINVGVMRDDLPGEGWHAISQKQARPGDICIFPNYHTELVANNGARGSRGLIGSNGTSDESVSYNPVFASAVFYAPKGE